MLGYILVVDIMAALRRLYEGEDVQVGDFKVRFRYSDDPREWSPVIDLATGPNELDFDKFRGFVLEINRADRHDWAGAVKVRYGRSIESGRRIRALLERRLAARDARILAKAQRRASIPADYDTLDPLAKRIVDGKVPLHGVSQVQIAKRIV